MFSTVQRLLTKVLPLLPFLHRTQEKRRAAPVRPTVDALEDRLVCDVSQSFPDLGDAINPHLGSVNLGPAMNSIMYTPMVVGDKVVTHLHPHVTIIINGKQQTVPSGIGILGDKGVLPIHTHDASGVLHVETLVPNTVFRLKDFFAAWGQTFTSTDILGHRTDARHRITMTVNGVPSKAFGNLVLSPNQGPTTDTQGHLLTNPTGIVITYSTIGGGGGGGGHHAHHAHHKK
jgi:hypothetical protein